MMDFLVMTQRADGTTVIWSVTQIANPDGRCLMIWRRYRCKATRCNYWPECVREGGVGCWGECFGVQQWFATWGARTSWECEACQMFLNFHCEVETCLITFVLRYSRAVCQCQNCWKLTVSVSVRTAGL